MPKSSVEVRQERTYSPSLDSMLKISLGVSIFAVLSFALVYGETISVQVDGTSYNVEYTSDAATLSSPIVETGEASLRFTVDAPDSAGTLDITFQRSFFDSQRDGLDEEFFVIVDGLGVDVTESETSTTRSLSIEIPAGTEEVEIIGSVIAGTDQNPPDVVDEPEPPVPDPVPDPVPTPDPAPAPTPDPDPVVDTPDTQCGVGTKLQDGQCVLDDTCGPGTVLVGGQCIIDQSAIPSTKSLGKDLGVGFFAAFAAAGIIGVFLGIVAKASRSGN